MRLAVLSNPQEYFQSRVSSAASHLQVSLDDQLEFYLVNLLVEFMNPEQLNQGLGPVDVMETPLATMLQKALDSPPSHQLKLYKRMGDTSLYVAGFFQEFFNRKPFDVSYYCSMGSTAYRSVSAIMRDRHKDDHFAEVYMNLSDKFDTLVEVVAGVSESDAQQNPSDLVSVYDRWMRSPSERLRKILERAGINPIPVSSKTEQ